ncbi:MAG: PAS domain-containing protein, partial [Terriglobales bacterium]
MWHWFAPLRLQDLAEISSVLALLAALLYRHFRKKYLQRSQRQWAETLDSVTDCILVHDGAFRIMRVNRALRRRLGRPAAALLHQPCESVLPRLQPWSQCPYCGAQSAAGSEAAD